MIAYLAHPIDFGALGTGETVQALTRTLNEHGYQVYDPAAAWSVNPAALPTSTDAKVIWQVNEQARGSADLVVAYLPAGVRSYGVPAEIAASVLLGRVIIVSDPEPASWWLCGIAQEPQVWLTTVERFEGVLRAVGHF